MAVKELIALLKKMPQDAIVIRTCCSDYDDVEPEQITLMQGVNERGAGLIRHNGPEASQEELKR